MPSRYASRVRHLLDMLAEDPDRQDADLKPLPGNRGFRLLTDDHRVIFDRDDERYLIEILRVSTRPDIYH